MALITGFFCIFTSQLNSPTGGNVRHNKQLCTQLHFDNEIRLLHAPCFVASCVNGSEAAHVTYIMNTKLICSTPSSLVFMQTSK